MQSVPSLLPEASKACAQVLVVVIARSPGPSTVPGSALEGNDMLHHRLRQRSDATLCVVGGPSPASGYHWGPPPCAHSFGTGRSLRGAVVQGSQGHSRSFQRPAARVVLPTSQRPAHSRSNAPPAARPRLLRSAPPAWVLSAFGELKDLRFQYSLRGRFTGR